MAGEPHSLDMVRILREVIDDPLVRSVGGSIQFGRFVGRTFSTSGIVETSADEDGVANVHYMRGALDLNDEAFGDKLFISYPLLDISSLSDAAHP